MALGHSPYGQTRLEPGPAGRGRCQRERAISKRPSTRPRCFFKLLLLSLLELLLLVLLLLLLLLLLLQLPLVVLLLLPPLPLLLLLL